MLFITEFTIRPGCWPQVAERFLSGKIQPPPHMKMLGRWHNADLSGGYSLFECDDMAAAYSFAAQWADLIDQRTHPVVEDADAGAGLAKCYTAAL
jgi:hypothetical protein